MRTNNMKARSRKARWKAGHCLVAGAGLALCGLMARADAQTAKTADSAAKSDADSNRAAVSRADAAPPQIEQKALDLLRRNQQAMFALKDYAVECRTTQTRANPKPGFHHTEYELATLVAQKPNKMRYQQWYLGQDDTPEVDWTKPVNRRSDTAFTCDGATLYQQFGSAYRASKLVAPKYMATLMEPWRGFYAVENSPLGEMEQARKSGELRVIRLDGRADVGGARCDKVFARYRSSYAGNVADNQITWYFGPDGLTRRCVQKYDTSTSGFTNDAVLVGLRFDAPTESALFAYTPPKGVKLEAETPPPPLLANGAMAPDFTGKDRDNTSVKLSDLRGRVVVIDFWASWCLPCNAAMPHNQAVIKKLQAEGLPITMLAVDNADAREAFDGWVKRQGKAFPALRFVFAPPSDGVSGQYRAATIPTQYVLDKQGRIVASFVGYDGPTDALEKAIRTALAVTEENKPIADAGR